MIAVLLTLVVLSWLPLVLIARARVSLSKQPAIHIFQDMDNQARYSTQQSSPVFADGRAMRPTVEGTVAWGHDARQTSPDALRADDHYYRGYKLVHEAGSDIAKPDYFQQIPSQIAVDAKFLQRGQERYNIYCFPCHGMDGQGEGPVSKRALTLMEANPEGTAWTPPSNIVAVTPDGQLQYGPELYPDGKLFNVISNGIRNMPAYRSQIDVKDRWAIVAYVRALQLSQSAPAALLSAEQRQQLK